MLIKNLLVFIHLIAMAVAVGRMLEFDLRFLRAAHLPLNGSMRRALRATQRTMTVTLALLWATGLALVALAAWQDPNALHNEKLWMKLVTVACLTVNGVVLHRFAFPLLAGGLPFLALPSRQRLGLTLCAVMSSVSWLYASFLGIARSWNHSASFGQVLAVYLALLALAALAATALVAMLAASRRDGTDDGATRFADTVAQAGPNT
ncbi:hypothetical protein [Roseateles sp. LKC17W]|uniref:DUF2214 family protein n=1 Tax=Pelomonas margarita TaxID=3299031 RepID=A0ABW7FI91_9BURK